MIDSQRSISRKEAKEALLRSGYLLESRVEMYLREHGGYVEANASYQDLDTGKSREYDVFALFARSAGSTELDYLFGALLVECVNNPQPLVVITKEPQVGFLHYQEVKLSGLPVKVPLGSTNTWQILAEWLGMDKYHHYSQGRVGTQFCSFLKKKDGRSEEWMAFHEGSHFDSFQKLCDVVRWHVDRHFRSWVPGKTESVDIQMYYPVVLLQGQLLEARLTPRGVVLRNTNHVQFRRSLVKFSKEEVYQIDVITENYLPKYMALVETELEQTAKLLKRRQKKVRKAMDLIAERLKGAESEEEVAKILAF